MTSHLTRRQFVQAGAALAALPAVTLNPLAAAESEVPQSVEELWADFDPRREPLEVELIREWQQDGGVYRYVRYRIGTFKGQPARMAAIYGFPSERKGKVPAVLHIHGGGQRAFLHEVQFMVGRGYAALSVNWGGDGDGKPPFNAPDGAQPDDPNTDWGAVDPTQLNVPGYQSVLPGPKQFFEDRQHPKNNNWYLLTLGCRRGLTFLEQQPEVDPERLGVHGYSMGGNLTMYVAGSDDRVKAAVPAVGGAGWRWQPHEFLGGTAQQDRIQGDLEMFRRTLSFENYAPRIRCPVLHRSGTNDFHGWMDDVYRTNALISPLLRRYCWSPHLNHRLTPEVEVAMPLWFDAYLKRGTSFPGSPSCELTRRDEDESLTFRVVAAGQLPIARGEIYYSVDPDPRARFWRSAEVIRVENTFTAKLPLHTLDLPLFVFANIFYTLQEPISLERLPGHRGVVRELCLSSELRQAEPKQLRAWNVAPTLTASSLIDDFAHRLRDWYQLNVDHVSLRQTWTRKLTDPLWRGAPSAKLKLTLRMPQTNSLTFVIHENEWRSYRGPRRTFRCEREIAGADAEQTVVLELSDFAGDDGPLKSWSEVDQFGICAHFAERGTPAQRAPAWRGPAATFVRLEWA